MSALRLEVETHIVTASATAVQNLTKCVAAAGVKIDELVVDSLASGITTTADYSFSGAAAAVKRMVRQLVRRGLAQPIGRTLRAQ